jgi:ABC-type proline/glycine betaine transport system permease subunit
VITALICFFPLLETTATSLRQVPPERLELFRMLGASRWQTLWQLKLPTGLPGVLAGLRVAVMLALVGAVVGEFIGASQGLGALVIAALGSMDTPLMFAVLVLIALDIAASARDRFGAFLSFGAAALFFWHAVINIGMVTNLLPVVGVPLLLMSYGGSSAVLGQYVSATSTRPFGSGLGLSRESRELAVENARKALNQMGSLLSTPPHYVEAARACGGARRRALRRAAASSAAAACARHTSPLRPVFAPSSPLQTACTSSRWRTTSPTAGARRTCWRRACTLCAGAKSRTTC